MPRYPCSNDLQPLAASTINASIPSLAPQTSPCATVVWAVLTFQPVGTGATQITPNLANLVITVAQQTLTISGFNSSGVFESVTVQPPDTTITYSDVYPAPGTATFANGVWSVDVPPNPAVVVFATGFAVQACAFYGFICAA